MEEPASSGKGETSLACALGSALRCAMHAFVCAVACVVVAGCGRGRFDTKSDGQTAADDGPSDVAIDAPRGPITFLQHQATICGTGTQCALGQTQPAQTGDIILVSTTTQSATATVVSITDTAGNTYAEAAPSFLWPVQPYRTTIWYTRHTGPPAMLAITTTHSAQVGFNYLYITEYQNVTAIDQTTSMEGNGTTLTPSSGMLSLKAGEMIFGHGEAKAIPLGVGASFTVREMSNGNIEEDKIVAANGSYDASFTLSAPAEFIAIMVVLR